METASGSEDNSPHPFMPGAPDQPSLNPLVLILCTYLFSVASLLECKPSNVGPFGHRYIPGDRRRVYPQKETVSMQR